jgi:hypothetical protein
VTSSRADTLQDTNATEVIAVGRVIHVNPQYWDPTQKPVCIMASVTAVNGAGSFSVKATPPYGMKTSGKQWGDVYGNFTLDNRDWHWPRDCK